MISHLSRQEALGIPRPLEEDPEDLVVRRHQERVVADGVEDLDRDLVGLRDTESGGLWIGPICPKTWTCSAMFVLTGPGQRQVTPTPRGRA